MSGMPILAIGADREWRARMRRLFALRAGIRWLGAYASGEARPNLTEPLGLLLLDGDDPRVERERRRPQLPAPRRVYFFRSPRLGALQACLRAGARGCLDKHVSADAVLRAVTAAESGLFVMSSGLMLHLQKEPVEPVGSPSADDTPAGRWFGLTERQRQVVDCVMAGMSNKEIARKLQISPETVKTHLQHVFEREGVHGRIALLADVRQAAHGASPSIHHRPGQSQTTVGEQT